MCLMAFGGVPAFVFASPSQGRKCFSLLSHALRFLGERKKCFFFVTSWQKCEKSGGNCVTMCVHKQGHMRVLDVCVCVCVCGVCVRVFVLYLSSSE